MFKTYRSLLLQLKTFNNLRSVRGLKQTLSQIKPEFDTEYLTNPVNFGKIESNITHRKGVGNIQQVQDIVDKLKQEKDNSIRKGLQNELQTALSLIPNQTHPDVIGYGDQPMQTDSIGSKRNFDFKPKSFAELCKTLNILRTQELGNFNGSKSYYLLNELAELEEALIRYTINELNGHGFVLISVPEILPPQVIEGCGMKTSGERNQVYKTLQDNLCLSGTSKMALAGYFAKKRFHLKQLPVKVMAVSHCYRAEVSSKHEEQGIFRVHTFNKVEMFSVCSPSQSEQMLEELKRIEIELFKKLNLHFLLLDMPPCELGVSWCRKFDIEAWMPGREMYGEISSCSNCTDFQARRLDIRCNDENERIIHAHTLNGTACAVPRMLIAIVENFQNENGTINIPKELQMFMNGRKEIQRTKRLPVLKLVKHIDGSRVQ